MTGEVRAFRHGAINITANTRTIASRYLALMTIYASNMFVTVSSRETHRRRHRSDDAPQRDL